MTVYYYGCIQERASYRVVSPSELAQKVTDTPGENAQTKSSRQGVEGKELPVVPLWRVVLQLSLEELGRRPRLHPNKGTTARLELAANAQLAFVAYFSVNIIL